jgi:hypothetical protein
VLLGLLKKSSHDQTAVIRKSPDYLMHKFRKKEEGIKPVTMGIARKL